MLPAIAAVLATEEAAASARGAAHADGQLVDGGDNCRLGHVVFSTLAILELEAGNRLCSVVWKYNGGSIPLRTTLVRLSSGPFFVLLGGEVR